MTQDLSTAYAQLKSLEDAGYIKIPEPVETKTIGIIDPAAGTFKFSVPVIQQTSSLPPGPGGRTNVISTWDSGYVTTTAAKLLLRLEVIPQPRSVIGFGAGDAAIGDRWNGGVTVEGYPTVSSTADEIVVDIGHDCSAFDSGLIHLDPPVSWFMVTIHIPDKPPLFVHFLAMRPPILGLGAFTLPALPVTIVYAPPQNAMKQNTVTYTSTSLLSRKFTTSLTNSTNTVKTDAYSIGDYIAKGTALATSVAAFVGSGGAAAVATSPLVIRALQEFTSAIAGSPAKKDHDDLFAALGATKDALNTMGKILEGFQPVMGGSDQSSLTTETDNSVTLTVSTVSEHGSKAGLGPGVGDRILFMRNVRFIWMAAKGEVTLSILGYESLSAYAVDDLQEGLRRLEAGNPTALELDATTIRSLLALDPLIVRPSNVNTVPLHGAVIRAPRFIPADPPGFDGAGTDNSGDGLSIKHSKTVTDVHWTSQTNVTVTDFKPGWIKAMVGLSENTETTTTVTMTTTQSVESTQENGVETALRLYAANIDDLYKVRIFEDLLLKTYVILDKDSPLLHGVVGNDPQRSGGGGGMARGGTI